MSITDELREVARTHTTPELYTVVEADTLFDIANRIDEEHKRALTEQLDMFTVGMKPMTDENMAEGGWIRLPKDADGEVIRIGDVMEWVQYDETYPSVVREVAAVGVDVFFAWDKASRRYAQYEAHAYRHHHKTTVEDMLIKMLEEAVDYSDAHTTVAYSAVSEYADRIREAVEHE